MSPSRCLHDIVAEQARVQPDRIALSCSGIEISYRELDERADRLAAALVALGVRPNVLIGLCARRGPDAVVGMLGILKAGGAYVPIDPGYPDERIDYLLTDCATPLVVATPDTADRVRERQPAVVLLDGDRVATAGDIAPLDSAGVPWRPAGERDLAYVIYTSGSTGAPKGVAVEHRNVVRLFAQSAGLFGFDADDVWALFHSISFDFSVWEIWGALVFGGRLVLLPDKVARSPARFTAALRAERVTVLNQTPSAFRQLLGVASVDPRVDRDLDELALRLVVFGGERLDPRFLAPWFARHGADRPVLVNMYGITETTVHCTYRRITEADVHSDGSPIGVALPDVRIQVSDEHGDPVPDGVPGEMYVGGSGVARGYLNRPELTARRFVTGPGDVRRYRSGDRAVRSPGGELTYLGRIDDQLKVRGYRIEPGEIEACLLTSPHVAAAVVTARDFGDGDVRLVAHLLPADPSGPDVIAAAEHQARKALPEHLRPAKYRVVSEIPMTMQGKVDRDALAK